MQLHTVNGPVSAYRRRRSGRRLRGERMADSIHGATSLHNAVTQITDKRGQTAMDHWRQWGRSKRVKAPMASMTWPGMSGNGSVTGMTMIFTRIVRRGIL